jgi:DNA-binding NarL/FixJ family response regulator
MAIIASLTKQPPAIISEDYLTKILCLADREYEVFCALGEGLKCIEIAQIPGRKCATATIEAHVARVMEKLNFASKLSLQALATRYLVYKEQNFVIEKAILKPRTHIQRRELVGA